MMGFHDRGVESLVETDISDPWDSSVSSLLEISDKPREFVSTLLAEDWDERSCELEPENPVEN